MKVGKMIRQYFTTRCDLWELILFATELVIIMYRVGEKKLYPPTFLLTLAIPFKITQKILWIMAAAGSDDNIKI